MECHALRDKCLLASSPKNGERLLQGDPQQHTAPTTTKQRYTVPKNMVLHPKLRQEQQSNKYGGTMANDTTTSKRAILVIGAGDATGGAIAKRFAREGYIACVTRRNADKLEPLVNEIKAEGCQAHGFGSDARVEDEMIELIQTIEKDIAPIEVAVFHIGANVRFPIADTTARVYYKVWEMGCFAGFLMGREVSKVMLPRKRGTIIFTGATASLRGGSGFAAFAGAKNALRALAQ